MLIHADFDTRPDFHALVAFCLKTDFLIESILYRALWLP